MLPIAGGAAILVGEVVGAIMTPMFYVAVQWFREKVGGWRPPSEQQPGPVETAKPAPAK